MKNLNLQILLVAVLVLAYEISFSQTQKPTYIERTDPAIKTVSTMNDDNFTGVKDAALERNLDEQRLLGNKDKIESLKNELIQKYDLKKETSELKIVTPVGGNLFKTSNETDVSSITNITNIDSGTFIFSQGTITEQTGNNTGRIWNVYIIRSSQIIIKVIYSDDNGLNWNHFTSYQWGFPQYDIYTAETDVEIAIDAVTNNKALHIIFECEDGTYYSTGYVRIDVGNNPGLSTQQLFTFGVNNPGHKFYTPRLATDNANYHSYPYVFISMYELFNHTFLGNIYSLRFATVFDATNVFGNINYGNLGIASYSAADIRLFDFCSFNYGSTTYVLFADAAYLPYLIVTQYTAYDALNYGSGYSTSIGNGSNILQIPSVSSDGSTVVIASMYQYSVYDEDICYYKTSSGINGLNFGGWIDNSLSYEKNPMLISKWNSNGKFSCAYSKVNSSVNFYSFYLSYSNVNLFDSRSKMVSTTEFPAFAILNFAFPAVTRNDECFISWINPQFFPDMKIYSATGCSGSISMIKTANLKLFIEGYYLPNTNNMISHDTVQVYIRSFTSPFGIVDSAKGPVTMSGNVMLNFGNVQNNVNYFVVVKHRNSIETWSRPNGVMFTGDHLNFDFSLSNGQSYGANQKQVDQTPVTYSFFGGDANQDGNVDVSDIVNVYNDVLNVASGYLDTDMTGDNFVDAQDLILTYNNARNVVGVARP